MKFGLKKVIIVSFLLMFLVPTIFGIQQGSIEEITEGRCDALESYEGSNHEIVNISENRIVKLNGENVDQVNCSKIDSYEFGPDEEEKRKHLVDQILSFSILYVLIPLGYVGLIGGFLKNKGYFEWKEIAKIFLTSISAIIAITFSIILLNEASGISGLTFLLFMFSGGLISVIFTAMRIRRKNSRYKVGGIAALLFYLVIFHPLYLVLLFNQLFNVI